jgi:rare lipoprotein A
MTRDTGLARGRAGSQAAADVAAKRASDVAFRMLSSTSAAACLFFSVNVQAAGVNTEAASPQRSATRAAVADPPKKVPPPRANHSANASSTSRVNPVSARSEAASAQAASPTTTRRTTAAAAPTVAPRPSPVGTSSAAPRPVAAVTRPAPAASARQISITGSEPGLSSTVRPQDVADFQKIGAPYQINDTWYVPAHEPDYDETGVASWYGSEYQGRPTANGELFDMNVPTAAHPTLPIPSLVEVTNLTNGRSIVVRVNDRGPFVGSRMIDLSARGAQLLGFLEQGHTDVRVRYVGPANNEPLVTAQNLTAPRQITSRSSVKPLRGNSEPNRQMAAYTTPPMQPAHVKTAPAPSRLSSSDSLVQIGAFSRRANAERAVDQAIHRGPVRIIETAMADGNPLYRVVLGPMPNRAQADNKLQEMASSGTVGVHGSAALD